jgi:hypothetical protein
MVTHGTCGVCVALDLKFNPGRETSAMDDVAACVEFDDSCVCPGGTVFIANVSPLSARIYAAFGLVSGKVVIGKGLGAGRNGRVEGQHIGWLLCVMNCRVPEKGVTESCSEKQIWEQLQEVLLQN